MIQKIVLERNNSWKHASQVKFLECCPFHGYTSFYTECVAVLCCERQVLSLLDPVDYSCRNAGLCSEILHFLPGLAAQAVGADILNSIIWATIALFRIV